MSYILPSLPPLGSTTVSSTSLSDGVTIIPASSGIVTIRSDLLVTAGLTIAATGKLVIYGDLIITGNFTITAGGTLTVYGNITGNAIAAAANKANIAGTITTTGDLSLSNYSAVDDYGVLISSTTIIANNMVFKNNMSTSLIIPNAVRLDTVTLTATNDIIFENNTSIIDNNNVSGGDQTSGAYIDTSCTLSATDITFNNNTASGTNGYGVFIIDGSDTITGNTVTFEHNQGSSGGSGVFNNGFIRATEFILIQDCTSLVERFDNTGAIYRHSANSVPTLVLINNGPGACTNISVPSTAITP